MTWHHKSVFRCQVPWHLNSFCYRRVSFLYVCSIPLSTPLLCNGNLICATTSHKLNFIYSNGKLPFQTVLVGVMCRLEASPLKLNLWIGQNLGYTGYMLVNN